MALTRVQRFHQEGRVAAKFAGFESYELLVWGAMLQVYAKYTPKPTTKEELKAVLTEIRDSLPEKCIKKAVVSVTKRLQMCTEAEGGHIQHLLQ